MKFLVAPCAYKGTFTATAIAGAISSGCRSAFPSCEIAMAPIADGGDGTIEALAVGLGGAIQTVGVRGPVDNPVTASWLRWHDSAIVELAGASGIALLPDGKLSALDAHTYGLGQVIVESLSYAPKVLYVCVGGSASTDGGAGALVALGAQFFDASGDVVFPNGRNLPLIESCDLSRVQQLLANSSIDEIYVAVDVVNPLLGESGAASIFGPQKGASPADVAYLEHGLERLANVLELASGRSVRNLPGAGAAGGTAFGVSCALGAKLTSGFHWIAKALDLESKVKQSDFVITAEGSLDSQSASGKAIGELAKICRANDKPLFVFPAVLENGIDWWTYGIQQAAPTVSESGLATLKSVRLTVENTLRAIDQVPNRL